jgi:hypothetical protein
MAKCYAVDNFCQVSFVLSVANKPSIPSVTLLNVIMLSVDKPNVVTLSVTL